jgi:DNA-binding CsgD family transcriptional regulator
MRAGRMADLRKEGKSVQEIAGIFGVSVRTVQRALKWWRQ